MCLSITNLSIKRRHNRFAEPEVAPNSAFRFSSMVITYANVNSAARIIVKVTGSTATSP